MDLKCFVTTLASIVLAIGGAARADPTLSLTTDGTLSPGGTIAIDIRASDPSGPLPLAFYDLTLTIGGQPVSPSFVVPSQASSLIDDPSYVFFGDSASTSNYPGTVSSSPNGPATLVEVTDFTESGNDATLSSSTLLSRAFLHLPNQPLPPGGEALVLSLTSADLESDSGPYTISGPLPTLTIRAVPEPASLILLTTGSLAYPLARFLSRFGIRGT